MRLIDADKLELDWIDYTGNASRDFKNYLKNVPTIEVEPVRYGEWKESRFSISSVKCSVCHSVWENETNYCPNCGAKMKG